MTRVIAEEQYKTAAQNAEIAYTSVCTTTNMTWRTAEEHYKTEQRKANT